MGWDTFSVELDVENHNGVTTRCRGNLLLARDLGNTDGRKLSPGSVAVAKPQVRGLGPFENGPNGRRVGTFVSGGSAAEELPYDGRGDVPRSTDGIDPRSRLVGPQRLARVELAGQE